MRILELLRLNFLKKVKNHFAEGIAADDLVLLLRERFGVECVQCNQLLADLSAKWHYAAVRVSFLLDAGHQGWS